MSRFHVVTMKTWVDFQPGIGNLAIAVELLLKSVVASRAIRQLYTNLPDEAQVLLSYPESLPEHHKPQLYIRDMKSFVYKTIELDKAVTLFNMFFPEKRQEFKQFFTSLATIRNVSVHAAVPDIQRYELERLAYFSTRLFEFVKENKVHKRFVFKPDNQTQAFLGRYADDEISKVKKKIKEAEKRAKAAGFKAIHRWPTGWDEFGAECLVCGEYGVTSGETLDEIEGDDWSLIFECYSFTCDSCGLDFSHYDEMSLAGMETHMDRSDEAEEYLAEFHSYEE